MWRFCLCNGIDGIIIIFMDIVIRNRLVFSYIRLLRNKLCFFLIIIKYNIFKVNGKF